MPAIAATRPTQRFTQRSGYRLEDGLDSKSKVVPGSDVAVAVLLPMATIRPITILYACSYPAVIRVYAAVGNVIETHEHKGEFQEW
jgi:hypothetical protein